MLGELTYRIKDRYLNKLTESRYYTVTQIVNSSANIKEEDLLLVALIKNLELPKRTLRNIFNISFFKRYDTFRNSIKRLEEAGYIYKSKKHSKCYATSVAYANTILNQDISQNKKFIIQVPEYLIYACKLGKITFPEMLQLARIECFERNKDKDGEYKKYFESERNYAKNITGRSKTKTRSKDAVYFTLKKLDEKHLIYKLKGVVVLSQSYWEMCYKIWKEVRTTDKASLKTETSIDEKIVANESIKKQEVPEKPKYKNKLIDRSKAQHITIIYDNRKSDDYYYDDWGEDEIRNSEALEQYAYENGFSPKEIHIIGY